MENIKKYERGTLGWLRERQNIKSKKNEFDNVDNWLKWKVDTDREDRLLYLKRSNNPKEYRDRCAQRSGFKSDADRQKERDHNNGKQLPMEFNEDCSSHFGVYIAENYIMKTFEDY